MWGKGIFGNNSEENANLIHPFMQNRSLPQHRILAALGFCFSGRCVLDLARTGVGFRGVIRVHRLFKLPGNTLGILQ